MKKNQNVFMGTMTPSWENNKKIKTVTFSITDDCNLRCSYCYFTHKTKKNIMSFYTAKKAIDDILSNPLYFDFEGVIWEFIGGEPTIEMALIDQISDYILYKMYSVQHRWLKCYHFMIGSNGLLYTSDLVQQYIKKHYGNLYIAITIDGSKEKHDLSRKKADGTGSYDEVARIIPLWQKQFSGTTTKATFSHADLPYLKNSIISLWNMGIKCVSANIVFENVWHENDGLLFKQQLYELANYIIDNDLWNGYSVRFFDPTIGTPYNVENINANYCGTGSMLAINTAGDYYPCVRFMPSAIVNHPFAKLGSVENKIDTDRLRGFYILNTKNQSNDKCLKCDIAGGCSWCSGLNYDDSSIGTLFERQTHLCQMHKANVEVNKYLWRKYELAKHTISPYRYKKLTSISKYNKYLYVICDSKFPSFCQYVSSNIQEITMSNQTLKKVVEFCEKNNYVPIFCGCKELPRDYYAYQIVTLQGCIKGDYSLSDNYQTQLLINVDDSLQGIESLGVKNIIITYNSSQLTKLINMISHLNSQLQNLNICISMIKNDITPEKLVNEYGAFLNNLYKIIVDSWNVSNHININVITYELFAREVRSCGAGSNSFSVSPNGKIYLCPGFYYKDPEDYIGDIDSDINNIYSSYCDMENAPLCKGCYVLHCSRCVLQNKIGTGEYHIPTELQCVISHMEYKFTNKLAQSLKLGVISLPGKYNNNLHDVENFDPLYTIKGKSYPSRNLNRIAKEIKY